jgi:hypothetical protein
VTEPQLSLAEGVPSETFVAKHFPGAVLIEMGAGGEIVGGLVSSTVMVNEQELLLPLESRAV